MELFDRLLGELQSFQDHVDTFVIDLAENESDLIEEMNKDRVSDINVYVTGVRITPDYAPSTQKRKKKIIPDLYETGDFVGAIAIRREKDSLYVYSRDKKYKQGYLGVYEKDGDLFGLTEGDQNELGEVIKPKLINKFRANILGS